MNRPEKQRIQVSACAAALACRPWAWQSGRTQTTVEELATYAEVSEGVIRKRLSQYGVEPVGYDKRARGRPPALYDVKDIASRVFWLGDIE